MNRLSRLLCAMTVMAITLFSGTVATAVLYPAKDDATGLYGYKDNLQGTGKWEIKPTYANASQFFRLHSNEDQYKDLVIIRPENENDRPHFAAQTQDDEIFVFDFDGNMICKLPVTISRPYLRGYNDFIFNKRYVSSSFERNTIRYSPKYIGIHDSGFNEAELFDINGNKVSPENTYRIKARHDKDGNLLDFVVRLKNGNADLIYDTNFKLKTSIADNPKNKVHTVADSARELYQSRKFVGEHLHMLMEMKDLKLITKVENIWRGYSGTIQIITLKDGSRYKISANENNVITQCTRVK